jgi:hypothetical protein
MARRSCVVESVGGGVTGRMLVGVGATVRTVVVGMVVTGVELLVTDVGDGCCAEVAGAAEI